MRELKTRDIFTLSEILSKMEIHMDFVGKDAEQTGGELILAIGSNLYKAEKEVSAFVADMAGITVQEFNEKPLSETIKMIAEVKGLLGFFKQAGLSKKSKR